MQEAFKKVEKDAFRYAGENERLKKTIEQMQEELDNLRRDAEVMRAVLERAAAGAQPAVEKGRAVPKAPVKKPVREVTQISAFDPLPEEPQMPLPSAPVPPARPAAKEETPAAEPAAPEAPQKPTEEKAPKKAKKDTKGKSHIGSMFDLLTFSDI